MQQAVTGIMRMLCSRSPGKRLLLEPQREAWLATEGMPGRYTLMTMLARRGDGRRKGSPQTLELSDSRRRGTIESSRSQRRERWSRWLANPMPIGCTAVDKQTLQPSISVSYLVTAWATEMRSKGR